MICRLCNGLVVWDQPYRDGSGTSCKKCGKRNCQVIEPESNNPDDKDRYILIAKWGFVGQGYNSLDLKEATNEEIVDFLIEHDLAEFKMQNKDD